MMTGRRKTNATAARRRPMAGVCEPVVSAVTFCEGVGPADGPRPGPERRVRQHACRGRSSNTQAKAHVPRADATPPLGDARLRGVVERAPVAMAVLDRELRYLAVSRRFLIDHGLGAVALIGRLHDDVFPPVPERWSTLLERCVAGATERLEASPYPRPDGRPKAVRWDITPWYTDAHEIGGLILVSDVLTEREPVREQRGQGQKMQALGHLAGGVAHDFNNLLTIILGYSELLTRQIGPDKSIGRDLRQIMAAAQRAATLTRQLLAFSRKQVLKVAPVDLSAVVADVEPMFRRLIGEQITVETVIARDLPPVMADVAQLEHVLMNLVVNARDAMPRGGVVTMATGPAELDRDYAFTHPGAKAGSYAMVSVRDTGIGMSPEIRARVFEPLFTTKERGHGTGLGLAAVYGIVKQLGGYIGVDSAPGRGTTFEIYLPTTTEAVLAPQVPLPLVASPVGREAILLVEDDDNARAFVKTVLERYGYRVLDANSAEAAVTLLDSQHPSIQLLLTDVVLPGLDGRELAARVTRAQPHVPVLYMSGYMGRLRTAKGFHEPGVQLLEKPFTAHALLTRTRELLGQADDREPVGASPPRDSTGDLVPQ